MKQYKMVDSLKPKGLIAKIKWLFEKRRLENKGIEIIEAPSLESLGFLSKSDYSYFVSVLNADNKIHKHLVDIFLNKIPDKFIVDENTINDIRHLANLDRVFMQVIFTREEEIFFTGAGLMVMQRYIKQFVDIGKND